MLFKAYVRMTATIMIDYFNDQENILHRSGIIAQLESNSNEHGLHRDGLLDHIVKNSKDIQFSIEQV